MGRRWVGSVRWGARSLQERGLADDTLDVHGFLVDLELRLGDDLGVALAVALRGCFCSLVRLLDTSITVLR
jgi:hypothetical protein